MTIRLSLLVLLLFAALPAAAQAPQEGWIAGARTGCRVWNPRPLPNETITWTGLCVGGLAQGRGVVQWFKDGKPGGRNEGEYRDGKANGRGVHSSPDGSRYEGEYRDGKRAGRGMYSAADGSSYEGEFRDGKESGRGVITWPSGKRYEGQLNDNKANGHGKYVSDNGTVYEGTWSNGCFRQGNRRAWVGATAEECGFK